MKTQPFDLQKALAGHPVVTRDGRKVIRIAHFPEASLYPVAALIDKQDGPLTFTESGNRICCLHDHFDLFLEVKTVKRWGRVAKYIPDGRMICTFGYTSKGVAESQMGSDFEVFPAYEYEAEE